MKHETDRIQADLAGIQFGVAVNLIVGVAILILLALGR